MKSVLIVEDEELLLGLLRDILADSGYHVYQARNGADALKVLDKNTVDLVISDIDMPIKNGIEFLKEFRKLDSSTPVVIMSGGFIATESELLQLGATKFVRKPLPSIQSLLEIAFTE